MITSSSEVRVRTVTLRLGKIVEKRVEVFMRSDPSVIVLSLLANEAISLGRRVMWEGQAIEGGVR